MSTSIRLREGQKYIYKVEILQVFKPQSYQERRGGVERVRMDKPEVVEIGWYDSPGSARNYGSYRTGRKEWYANVGKPTHEYVRVDKTTGERKAEYDYTNYEYVRREVPQPIEPDKDYRVYRIPVNLDMGEAVLLPPLKRLYEIAE